MVNPTILALREMPKPVIARVHGHAVGIGCNYALAADIRIATTDAKFGQVFSKIGLIPDGGSTYFLPRMIGYPKAFEWMITGAIIDAQQAAEWGLVNCVVPLKELDGVVDQWIARLTLWRRCWHTPASSALSPTASPHACRGARLRSRDAEDVL